jgi:hypothetical protein
MQPFLFSTRGGFVPSFHPKNHNTSPETYCLSNWIQLHILVGVVLLGLILTGKIGQCACPMSIYAGIELPSNEKIDYIEDGLLVLCIRSPARYRRMGHIELKPFCLM